MNGSDDRPAHLTVNVNQSHVRNAVRDIVTQMLSPESAKQEFDRHTEKMNKKLSDHVDAVIAKINVPRDEVNRRTISLLERDLRKIVQETVAHEVHKILRDEISVAIRHIVQTGMTIEIGTGWNQKVQIKTEEKA